MTFFIVLITILQSFSISLGVGSSTLAIINFFVAISDGKIDETERKMMGVTYIILRVSMVLILVTSVILLAYQNSTPSLPPFAWAQLLTLIVLFVNAMLMTARLMPSTFGPALQAGSWYTLGTLLPLQFLGLTEFTFTQFLMAYVTWLILATGIVNGIMAILKSKRES